MITPRTSIFLLRPSPRQSGRIALGLALLALAFGGCRGLMKRGPVPESVAASRSLSAQGLTALDVGDWRQAEIFFEQAIEACPTDANARREYAELLWQRDKRDAALAQIEKASILDPEEAEIHVRAGAMYLALGKTDSSLQKVDRALHLDAGLTSAWALRGRVMQAAGKMDRALADFHRALSLSPESPDLLFDIAKLHEQRGQPQRALVVLLQLSHLYPPGEAPREIVHRIGLAQLALGRYEDSIESLYIASVRGTASPQILHDLAVAEFASGRKSAAAANLRQALTIDPNHRDSQALARRIQGLAQDGVVSR